MAESILTSIKSTLGIADDYTVYDAELILQINAVFAELHQLGVGPALGFAITDKTAIWAQLLGPTAGDADPRLNNVQSYVGLKVKLIFDPPEVGYVLTSYEKVLEQMQWRITNAQDEITRPPVVEVVETPLI